MTTILEDFLQSPFVAINMVHILLTQYLIFRVCYSVLEVFVEPQKRSIASETTG